MHTHVQWTITRSSAELMGNGILLLMSLSVALREVGTFKNNNHAHTHIHTPLCLVMLPKVFVISTSYYSDTHVSDPSCTVDQNQ